MKSYALYLQSGEHIKSFKRYGEDVPRRTSGHPIVHK